MIPSPGRIVEYTLNALDAQAIYERREHSRWSNASRESVGIAYGNLASVGDIYPMVIVRVWGDSEAAAVNGQVLLDGIDIHWVTSRVQGDAEGQWREFPRV